MTGAKRIDALPDVPTLQEAGLAGYEAILWMAIVAPGGTPEPIIARLQHAMQEALAAPDVAAALRLQEMEPESSTPEAVRSRISAEVGKWQALAAAAGLKVEP